MFCGFSLASGRAMKLLWGGTTIRVVCTTMFSNMFTFPNQVFDKESVMSFMNVALENKQTQREVSKIAQTKTIVINLKNISLKF